MKIFGGTFTAVILLLFQPLLTQGQSELSLGSSFFGQNRAKVQESLPEKSVAVFFSAPFSNHQPQLNPHSLAPYIQEPNFFYLTGITSPKCVLVLFSEPLKYGEKEVSELLFYPDNADYLTRFTGIRANVKGFSDRESIGKWAKFCRDYLGKGEFEKIHLIPREYSSLREPGFLSTDDLLQAFFTAISPGYPLSGKNMTAYRLIKEGGSKGPLYVASQVNAMLNYYPQLASDPLLDEASRLKEDKELERLLEKLAGIKIDVFSLKGDLEEMRRVKTSAELQQLKKVAGIMENGMREAIGALKIGKSEYELAAVLEFAALRAGAKTALPGLVAAGQNSGFIEYQTGRSVVNAGDPVVFDLAVQADGYCGRVTRTVPEGFAWNTQAKKEFEALLKAHKAAMAACQPGNSASDILQSFDNVLPKKAFPKMMRTRWVTAIGLSLIDLSWPPKLGESKAELKENMTLVIESALYGDDYGLVFRDVVLVKPEGGENLTGKIPYRADRLKAFVGN